MTGNYSTGFTIENAITGKSTTFVVCNACGTVVHPLKISAHGETHRTNAKTTPKYKRFTVAQLRETLADMPDDAEVFVGADGYEWDKAGLYATIGQITLPIIEV